MARIRSIKPEFWTAGQVMECSTNARLLFIGLWNFADDKGRHPNRPKQIKAEVFPGDDFTEQNILGMLLELSENDLITHYTVEDKEYFYITGWHHQRIDKPQKPKYPPPDWVVDDSLKDDSKNVPRTLPPDTIRYDTIRKDKKGKKTCHAKSVQDVFDYWFSVMGKTRAKLTDERKRKILKRLEDGYTVEEIKQAIDGCSKSKYHMGENPNQTIYNDIELICRDGKHLEGFRDNQPRPPSPSSPRM